MLRLCLIAGLYVFLGSGVAAADEVATPTVECFREGRLIACPTDVGALDNDDLPDVVEITHPTWVLMSGSNTASTIKDFKLTAVEGFQQGTTAWAIQFRVENASWSKNDVHLLVDFYTADGFPLPAPNNQVVVGQWRNACYYSEPEKRKRYDGILQRPYDEFVRLAAKVELSARGRGRQGSC